MADLVIREADGWEELEELQAAIRHGGLDIGELWSAVGNGSTKVAVTLLEDSGYEFDQKVTGVRMLSVPDDMLGERYRVWVKFGPRKES